MEFTLSLDEVNVLLAGLGELPAKVSYPLIKKIEQQVNDQRTADGDGTGSPS
jgi:hypothetical protein